MSHYVIFLSPEMLIISTLEHEERRMKHFCWAVVMVISRI